MTKLIKTILATVTALIVVVTGLIVTLTLVINPNDYKDQIAKLVQEQTGRRLVIKENFSLSFFPKLGVELGAMELGNADGFGTSPFAAVKSVRVRLQLLPLLKQQLMADTVVIDGLTVHLTRNSSGRNNWDDLSAGSQKNQPTPAMGTASSAAAGTANAGTPLLTSFVIGGIEIRNGALVWDDQMSRVRQSVQDLTVITGQLSQDQAVDLAISGRVDSDTPPLSARIRFASTATARLAQKQLLLAASRLEVTTENKSNATQQSLTLQFNADANLTTQQLSVTALKLEGMGLTLAGDISGRAIITEPTLQANLTLAEFNPQELLQRLSKPAIATRDANVLRKASATLKLEASRTEARLTELQLRLDDLLLQGTAGVKTFSKPDIGFNLSINEIDLDRYLPPPSSATKTVSAAPSSTPEENKTQKALPSLEPLRALTAHGTLKIAQLKAANAKMTNVSLALQAQSGILRVQPVTAQLYQGTLSGTLAVNAQSDVPAVEASYTLKQVQAGPLLKDIVQVERISGTAESSATLSAKGLDAKQVTRTLNGQLKFLFADGAVTGVNIARLIRNAHNTLKGLPTEPEESVQKTDFTRLEGSAVVTNGVARNQDLAMVSPLLRISGQGQANIPDDQVDYLVNTALVGTLVGQGGKELSELKNMTIPIKVSGRLSSPSFGLDLQALLQDNLKNQAKKEIQDKIGSKIKDQGVAKGLEKIVPRGLGGLLK
ncbi:MAG: AsmA family protein [Magnetococcales bacterium]|nr:AsmA family protein [Magnetococcales bacterium]